MMKWYQVAGLILALLATVVGYGIGAIFNPYTPEWTWGGIVGTLGLGIIIGFGLFAPKE